jgi:valyl-tRNA synthetase
MKVGRRLAIKLLNVSKFVLGVMGDARAGAITEPVDRSMLRALAATVDECSDAFAGYDYARALERAERFFWDFCDDYVELVKHRAYGETDDPAAASARTALGTALSVLQRLFAPFLVYVSEEVWSWWQDGSVHRAAWPAVVDVDVDGDGGPLVFRVAAEVLSAIRKAKSDAKVSMRAEVATVAVADTPERLAALGRAAQDVRNAGAVAELVTTPGDAFAVAVTLAEPPAS